MSENFSNPAPAVTAKKAWTFESVAQADRKTLEHILRTGTAPDMEQMVGHIYRGYTQQRLAATLTAQKYKKGFYKKDGEIFGYNELVVQDKKGYQGEWKNIMKKGRPIQIGYFRTSLVKDEPPEKLNKPYMHLGYWDYNISMNKAVQNLPFRVIRDFAVLPNEGDHSVILCKAYLKVATGIHFFTTYFMLGHPEEIKYPPW